MLQFCQHFTGRARLNIQASGQALLRGLSLFCQDDENAALAAFTLRDKAQHMPKFPQVDDQFVIGIRRMIMCQSLPSEVFFPVRMLMPLGNPSRAQIIPGLVRNWAHSGHNAAHSMGIYFSLSYV